MRAAEMGAPRTVASGSGAQGTDSTEILDDEAGVRKLRATLAARLALRGRELHPLAGGGFLVLGGGSVAHLGDLGAVKRFVAAMEGRP